MITESPPSPPPALVYAARYYDPRPKVRTHSHLYLWRVGQTGRGKLLTNGASDDTDPKASPDGKTVYFLRHTDDGKEQVCAADVQTGRTRLLWTAAAKNSVNNLSVSPSGHHLLVRQSLWQYKQQVFHQEHKIFAVSVDGLHVTLIASSAEPENLRAAWAASDVQVLILHPPRYKFNSRTLQQEVVKHGRIDTISLATPGAPPITLPNRAWDFSLEEDLSPNGRFIVRQANAENDQASSRFLPALFVRTGDAQIPAVATAEPNEILHWLSPQRLVGVDLEEISNKPLRFRFYDIPSKEPLTENGTISPSDWVTLHFTDQKAATALNEEGWDFASLSEVSAAPKRAEGFIIGTPWHRSDRGVRLWINVRTGAATLWSKCGPPHPSPEGTYFWEQPGSDYVAIGKRPNKTAVTEAVQSLNVASYANPTRLIPVVSGAAYANGADWLPVPTLKGKNHDTNR